MKTKTNKTKSTIKVLLLLIITTLLLITSCKKTTPTLAQNKVTSQVTPQENALLGKWQATKVETYEVTGIDSAGQYVCSLIGTTINDSACSIEFKNEFNAQILSKQLSGSGSLDSCGAIKQFKWNCTIQNLLEIKDGNTYNIVYLTNDSMALSRVYTKDILLLRSITYYKRKL